MGPFPGLIPVPVSTQGDDEQFLGPSYSGFAGLLKEKEVVDNAAIAKR